MVTAEVCPAAKASRAPDQRPHILFIAASLAIGGAEKHLLSIVNHLDRARFKLSLAYLKDEASLLVQLDRQQVEGRVFCCDVGNGIEPDVVRHLSNLFDDEGVHLVVAVNCYAYLYALSARLLARTKPKIACIFHSTAMLTVRERTRMAIYKRLFRLCDRVIYVCGHQQSYWRERGLKARGEQVIHNGIDLGRFTDTTTPEQNAPLRQSFGFASDDFVIGLCGAMRPEKAHVDLLQALALLPDERQPVRCLLIGDGPQRPAIAAAARELGVEHRIAITGYVADVRPYIAICDTMTLVSHTEAFSLAALEAMAMAKPLIMTLVGGAAEQVDHDITGFLVPPGRADCLAQCILALQETGAAAAMGLKARSKAAELFSLPAMVAAYEAEFDSLLLSRRHEHPLVGTVS